MVMTLLEVVRAFQTGCQAAFASPGAWLKGQTTFVLVIPGHYIDNYKTNSDLTTSRQKLSGKLSVR